jgi:murein DD-endopeptidase MepM/ murein hydrolase activator NlpD
LSFHPSLNATLIAFPLRHEGCQKFKKIFKRRKLEKFSKIGQFGLMRKARPGIPAHYHTAADFMRPSGNYEDEPIFPAARGIVISQRNDGPFAQVIIEHTESDTVWTVYEHLAGVKAVVGDTINPHQSAA